MNLFAGQQWRCRHGEQTCEHSRGRRGWDEWREQPGNIHSTIWKIDLLRGLLSGIQRFAALWTVVPQAPLSMGLSRQEYCSRLPWPPPDLPNPGIELLYCRQIPYPLSYLGSPL